jgi:hypothetical protein
VPPPEGRVERRRARDYSYLVLIALGAGFILAVVLTTVLESPKDPEDRATLYAVLGGIMSVLVAFLGLQGQKRVETGQTRIQSFFTAQLNSRHDRTNAVIEICEKAKTEFCAVTYFPVVGIQDDPDSAPFEYLNMLERKLNAKKRVVLVSVSCAEARKYCEEKAVYFPRVKDSLKALAKVESRLTDLVKHHTEHLTLITVPGSAITVNVCHNESTALMYHMTPRTEADDNGSGFTSRDPLVVSVAKGGAERYATYSHRNGGRRAEG